MPEVLPQKFEFSHGFCIFLHNEIVDLVRTLKECGALNVEVHEADLSAKLPHGLSGDDLFDWLERAGMTHTIEAMYLRSLVPALLVDVCHFTLEALNCSRKGKLTVSYALLRKPLRDTLFHLERLVADPKSAVAAFREVPATELAVELAVQRGEVKRTISLAIEQLAAPEMHNADLLYAVRFARDDQQSFAGLCDRALHLVTSFRAIRTEPQNLNFVFSDEMSMDSQWTHLYTNLPLVLSYALDVAIALSELLIGSPLPLREQMLLHRSVALVLLADDCVKLRNGEPTSQNSDRFLDSIRWQCAGCRRAISTKRALEDLYAKHSFKCQNCKSVNGVESLARAAS